MTATTKAPPLLRDASDGQDGDWFLLITRLEELKTKDGKPYLRISFRDQSLELSQPIWADNPWFDDCRQWKVGDIYKVRGVVRATSFGPSLEIKKWRRTNDTDRQEGFDPLSFLPRSRFDPQGMFQELMALADAHIANTELRKLTQTIYQQNFEAICDLPAAVHHHHAFRSGFLEHVLSVTKTAVYLATKYRELYPDEFSAMQADLVVAGAMLHDIGKLRELQVKSHGAEYSAAGELIGHAVLGRDMIREAARENPLEPELLLRLEHLVVSHQRTPEWGAPKPPMTLESLLVYYADDCDARIFMMIDALRRETNDAWITSARNALQQKVFRHLPADNG